MKATSYLETLVQSWEQGTTTADQVVRELRTTLAEEREIEAAEGESVDQKLAVWFGPQEIVDHYSDEESENAEWVRNASDEQLLEVGYACLNSDSLWAEFHRLIEECVEDIRGRETA